MLGYLIQICIPESIFILENEYNIENPMQKRGERVLCLVRKMSVRIVSRHRHTRRGGGGGGGAVAPLEFFQIAIFGQKSL